MASAIATLRFEAAAKDPRGRLDKLVVELLRRAGRIESRSTVQRWIAGGSVLVDGRAQRASAEVTEGAIIEVTPEPPPATSAEPDASITLDVVFEDAYLLVVNKPAGLVVHPARGHASGTLVNALVAREGFELSPSDPRDPAGHLRPGIVHRLDKGTSGLLVVAKDEKTREALKEKFAQHDIEREYVAIVVGDVKDATIESLHGRHKTDRQRFTSFVEEGRRAVTHVRVLERIGGVARPSFVVTVVACRLETGRTHQIRVHLSERLKAPILGDPVYGRPPRDRVVAAAAEELGRQALHARVLGFKHPITGEVLRWESAVPADMQRALTKLRATRSST